MQQNCDKCVPSGARISGLNELTEKPEITCTLKYLLHAYVNLGMDMVFVWELYSELIQMLSFKFSECSSDKSGQQYAGTVSTTVSGLTCQRWDDDNVHSQNYKDDDSAFIDGSVRAAENYCR